MGAVNGDWQGANWMLWTYWARNKDCTCVGALNWESDLIAKRLDAVTCCNWWRRHRGGWKADVGRLPMVRHCCWGRIVLVKRNLLVEHLNYWNPTFVVGWFWGWLVLRVYIHALGRRGSVAAGLSWQLSSFCIPWLGSRHCLIRNPGFIENMRY